MVDDTEKLKNIFDFSKRYIDFLNFLKQKSLFINR